MSRMVAIVALSLFLSGCSCRPDEHYHGKVVASIQTSSTGWSGTWHAITIVTDGGESIPFASQLTVPVGSVVCVCRKFHVSEAGINDRYSFEPCPLASAEKLRG